MTAIIEVVDKDILESLVGLLAYSFSDSFCNYLLFYLNDLNTCVFSCWNSYL